MLFTAVQLTHIGICVISSLKIFNPKKIMVFTTRCLLYIFRIVYKKLFCMIQSITLVLQNAKIDHVTKSWMRRKKPVYVVCEVSVAL